MSIASIKRWGIKHTLITLMVIVAFSLGLFLYRSVFRSVAIVDTCPTVAPQSLTDADPVIYYSFPLTLDIGIKSGLITLRQFVQNSTENYQATSVDVWARDKRTDATFYVARMQRYTSLDNLAVNYNYNDRPGTGWITKVATTLLEDALKITSTDHYEFYSEATYASGIKCISSKSWMGVDNSTYSFTDNLQVVIRGLGDHALATDSSPSNSIMSPTTLKLDTNVYYSLGSSIYFLANGIPSLFDVYSNYAWSITGVGSLSSDGGNAIYSSGAISGTAAINLSAEYAGRKVNAIVPVIVTVPTPSTTTTSASTTSTTTTPTPTPTDTTTTADDTAAPLIPESDCLITALGSDRFSMIIMDTDQPTPQELDKINVCYSKVKYVMPAVLSPVVSNEVKTLSTAPLGDVTISKLYNDVVQVKDAKKEALIITGKARPHQLVILYIFSEPMVITTKADKDGNWSYTLENPLEPGNHEVYAVVDRGDGIYQKTEPFAFVIGTAEASAENPNGLSLHLASEATPEENNRSIYIYIAGVVVLLGVVVMLVLVVTMIKHRRAAKMSSLAHHDVLDNNDSTDIGSV